MNIIIKKFIYSDKCTKDAIAELFYELYENECVYDAKKKKYYIMDENGIYHKDTFESLELKRKIHNKFYQCVEKQYIDELSKPLIDSERTALIKHKELFIRYTSNVSHVNGIIKQLKEMYKMIKEEECNLDENENIYAFTNGVYDMTEFEFRKGYMNEQVYSTCGYEYMPSDKENRKYVRKIFNRMFPHRRHRHNVLDMLALKLNNVTNNNECYILVGKYDDIDIFKKIICSLFDNFATLLNDGIPKKLILRSRCTSVILIDYLKCENISKALKQVVNNNKPIDFEKNSEYERKKSDQFDSDFFPFGLFTHKCSYFMVIEYYKNLQKEKFADECKYIDIENCGVKNCNLLQEIRSNEFKCALFDILIKKYRDKMQ